MSVIRCWSSWVSYASDFLIYASALNLHGLTRSFCVAVCPTYCILHVAATWTATTVIGPLGRLAFPPTHPASSSTLLLHFLPMPKKG